MSPSWPATMDTLTSYLAYDFVRHALIAGTLSAILGAVVGYFVVLRNVNFAAHALSHIGFTVAAALGIGVSGDRLQRSDMAIGMVLSISLGLGLLLRSYYSGYAGQTT